MSAGHPHLRRGEARAMQGMGKTVNIKRMAGASRTRSRPRHLGARKVWGVQTPLMIRGMRTPTLSSLGALLPQECMPVILSSMSREDATQGGSS